MAQAVTLRLPDDAAEELRRIARHEQRSVNEIGSRVVEEWLRQRRFAHIEFRSFGGVRHACIKERLPVWQLILVARDMDPAQAAHHLGLRVEQVQAGLNYHAAYPDEIDAAIEANALGLDGLQALFPGLEVVAVPDADPAVR